MIGPSRSAGAGRDALRMCSRASGAACLHASFSRFCERALALSELRLFQLALLFLDFASSASRDRSNIGGRRVFSATLLSFVLYSLLYAHEIPCSVFHPICLHGI